MANPSDTPIPYKGRRATLRYAVLANGSMPARAFLEGLSLAERAKFNSRIKVLGDEGELPNEQMFRRLDADIWEIKINSPALRLLCFRMGDEWVLTHGCRKLPRKAFQVEIQRARTIRQQVLDATPSRASGGGKKKVNR
ncbi:MAG: type II toxin-antitoxin system RelE/ParE family toxin [Phycisphaeraceae bacterium]|nr:type II toxin-antitoxin system RelE/ParE family toxin [Phycisphaeraceae bacterium]